MVVSVDKFVHRGGETLMTLMVSDSLRMLKSVLSGIIELAKKIINTIDGR